MRFTIITGLSGAGRSSALKTFEDMGYFCADNIPPALIPAFARLCLARSVDAPKNVAVVADMRMGDMFDTIYAAIDELKKMDLELDILFLDASDAALVGRFNQTRRVHPVSGSGNVLSGIFVERDKLQRIKDMANTVLDTTTYNARKLADVLEQKYSQSFDSRLPVSVVTFGYKRGIPIDADLVFDMRFLPNPFYIERLRRSSGLEKDVSSYVLSFPEAEYFLKTTIDLVTHLLPHYLEQDKRQLTIGIGCTGGMHRSVAIGQELYQRLEQLGHKVYIEHRDMNLEREAIKKRFYSSSAQ